MNLPNKLTVLRVIMIPFFLFFYFSNLFKYGMFIAFAIFVIAAITDWLDGKIARKHNLVTNFGKLMDPLADKLLVTAAMVCILSENYGTHLDISVLNSIEAGRIIPIVVLIVVLSRDLVVNAIRLVAASDGLVIAADILGKIKTVLQMTWLSLALFNKAIIEVTYGRVLSVQSGAVMMPSGLISILNVVELVLYLGMFVMTVVSGINYVMKNRKIFADA